MDYPSKVLAKAVEEISGLPGIGRKSALRLALHLLKQPESQAIALGDSLKKLVTEIKYCKECHNFSDSEICEICANPKRNDELIEYQVYEQKPLIYSQKIIWQVPCPINVIEKFNSNFRSLHTVFIQLQFYFLKRTSHMPN